MKFKAVVNSRADRGFVVVRNDSGSALVAGQAVVWDMAGTEDGFRVKDMAAGLAQLVVGLAHTAAADGIKCLVQTYGLDDDALMELHGVATNSNGSIGMIFDVVSNGVGLRAAAAPADNLLTQVASNSVASIITPYFVAAETFASASASSITGNKKVFIRCM